MTIARRRFLNVAWGTVLGLAFPLGLTAPARAASALTDVFGDVGAARAVGRAVLAAEAAPARPGALVEALLARHPDLLPLLDAGDRRRLAAAVGLAVRADFAAGRTRLVDGWILSESEADLCALACLS